MAGAVPLQYGQYYHIYNRGNNREDIFIEERNYRYFLKLYAKYVESIASTYAYCLLRNHFHFLIRIKTTEEQGVTEDARRTLGGSESPRVPKVFKPRNPSQQFSNLFNAYAKAINKTHGRTGSLFQNPFGRVPVTSDAYFAQLITYIHQNPQKHGFVDDFRIWPYSSYHTLISTKPTRLERIEVLAWFNSMAEFRASHRLEVTEHQISSLMMDDYG